MDRSLQLIFVLATAMLIAACGGLGTPAPAQVPTEEPTAAPTGAPAEMPSEVPTVTLESAAASDDAVEADLEGEFALALNQISLDTQNLAVAWQAVVVPGQSALFLLVAKVTPDKVLPHLEKFGGDVRQNSLSKEDEEKLRKALEHEHVSKGAEDMLDVDEAETA